MNTLRRLLLLAPAILGLFAIVIPASANSVPLSAGGCSGQGGSDFSHVNGRAYTNNNCSGGWRWIHAVFFDNGGGILDDYDPGWRTTADYLFIGSSSGTDLIQAGHSICPPAGSPCHQDFTTAP